MSTISFNIILSGSSVSGDLDTADRPLTIELGNSDRIGRVQFALQNSAQGYTGKLFSGNATVQVDAMLGNTVVQTVFRGTLEESSANVVVNRGSVLEFVGYDYGQELLGLVSPDARQRSALTASGTISLVSGEQGMGSTTGMDMVLYVSGVVGSGSTGSVTSGAQLNLFMSQYFGKSGDTTGSNSGQSFSFKPYLSGMVTSGVFPGSTYKTWYVADGASDTNANYWIPYDALKVKHETAWDVLRKLTRQGFVVDKSGFKTAFETFIDVSGGIHLRTSGTSDGMASGVSLIYYVTGASGSANNNLKDAKIKFNTTAVKNEIQAWFPTWTQYPFGDDYSDLTAYSGVYWSGQANVSGTVNISGNVPGPGAPGFISIFGQLSGLGAGANAQTGLTLWFTLWSGYSLNIQRWNVSGGVGVALNYLARPLALNAALVTTTASHSVLVADTSGNYIIKSGNSTANNWNLTLAQQSGWTAMSDVIYTASGTFFSGTGQDGGWAFGALVAAASGLPDLTRVKTIGIGSTQAATALYSNFPFELSVDNVNFQFAYNYNPVVALSSGSASIYGRRYEVFEFPYQTTDSGAAGIVLTELQAKEFTRGVSEFLVKDNPNLGFGAQLNITPGQVFTVDAPSLGAGSGQNFQLFRAIAVRHQFSHRTGFETFIQATSYSSGITIGSGYNLILYSLPMPIPVTRPTQTMPITHWWKF